MFCCAVWRCDTTRRAYVLAIGLIALSYFSTYPVSAQLTFLDNTTFLCYSCVSSPPKYAKFDDVALVQYLKQKRVRIPESSQECRDPDYWESLNRLKDVKKYMCESGVCVKLKGVFQGEIFVVRECWERLWSRPLESKPTDCVSFDTMWDTLTELCACSEDLCNSARMPEIMCGFLSLILLLTAFKML